MLMAALSFAIISIGTAKVNVEAYTAESLSEGTTASYHVASVARMMTLAIETCTSQMTAGDTTNVDTCLNLIKTFDRHLSSAILESNADIKTITGYGLN